ncbi:MAG: TonB-dependent receptor [Emcibacteraceae bacterium]
METTPEKPEIRTSEFWKSLLCTSAIAGVIMVSPAFAADEAAEKANEEQSVQSTTAAAAAEAAVADSDKEEVIVVVGKPTTYANNATDNVMIEQESTAASVLSVIDNLPGVNISEGGTFGSDDWSTTVNMRGFTVGLSEQQIGMTIDGLPNGNSNYGGGSKANRYIDFENLARAEVSQGTSDISSASHEALGGTINFVTNNPLDDQRLRASLSIGDHNARRYYFRYDTGHLTDSTTAYLSYSRQSNDAWIGLAGGTERDHISAKFVTELDNWTITGRFSWDDANEDNFQRISLAQFEENPDWDRLTDTITGIPYVDQAYRPSWSTLRNNYFTYLRAAYEDDALKATITPYYHVQKGRGDWVPQYIVDVTGGTTSMPSGVRDLHTGPDTIYGGSFGGAYSFVDAMGTPLAPIDGCTARLTFPYGGGGAGDNPACYQADANPASSYRHTHYNKQRIGLTADAQYEIAENNILRGGLWWERADRDESRDWHRIIDPRSSHMFDNAAYWRQYDRNFITDTFMLYGEDTLTLGDLTLNGGLRKFFVDLTRKDNFGIDSEAKVNSDSKILFTAGAIYEATDEVELFTGFSQNYAAIKDNIIEESAAIVGVDGEKADNYDLGLRIRNDWIRASLTGYYIKFSNRIVGIPVGDVSGIDYASQIDTVYQNVGGIDSKGIEASISADITDSWNLYSSLTVNDSKYNQTIGNVTKDKKVALAPEFQLVGTLSYQNDGIFGGVSAKHIGKRWGDFANTERLPSSTIFDLWIGYDIEMQNGPSNMRVSLNVNNLMDKRYLGGGTPGGYFIGTGRQVMANITFDY